MSFQIQIKQLNELIGSYYAEEVGPEGKLNELDSKITTLSKAIQEQIEVDNKARNSPDFGQATSELDHLKKHQEVFNKIRLIKEREKELNETLNRYMQTPDNEVEAIAQLQASIQGTMSDIEEMMETTKTKTKIGEGQIQDLGKSNFSDLNRADQVLIDKLREKINNVLSNKQFLKDYKLPNW